MVFASIEFLFLFLPLFLIAQSAVPKTNLVLMLFSLVFYWIGEGWFCAVVTLSVLANYGLAILIDRQQTQTARKFALGCSLVINVLPLVYFKYTAFLLVDVFGWSRSSWMTGIHLPLGISFFTFHAISYLIDIYRRDAQAERSLPNLAVYMLMFPQLIAGPILRFHTVADQLRQRVISRHHIFYGFALLIVGLGQKILLADTLAGICDPLFARWESLSAATAWLGATSYTLQIYFDFCGYSNMAIGLGWITGFRYPQNFNYPYIASSITDFWQRWHMSLSRWFRDYLYIPMGGNRRGNWATYRNLFVVFVLCGLWHGAAWTFLVWGVYHGAFLVLERMGLSALLERLPRLLRHAYTLIVVIVGWVFFRSESLSQSLAFLSKMFLLDATPDAPALQLLNNVELLTIVAALVLSMPFIGQLLQTQAALPTATLPLEPRPLRHYAFALACLMPVAGLAFMKIMTSAYSPFIYFRF